MFANPVRLGISSGMRRKELTKEQWERLQPLLPPQKPHPGRPAVDHRRILNGIVWLLRTGAPWRALPARYGPGRTVASRFSRWQKAGLWDPLFAAVQQHADATGQLDWGPPYDDGTIVRAHQHAAGAKQGARTPKRSAAGKAASVPKFTAAQKEGGNGCPWC